MKDPPALPPVADAPEALLARGHLWLQELVVGDLLRFRLRSSGAVEFGDRERVCPRGELPVRYRHAVRHVRERFDRDALRRAVDDVESVVFVGVATHDCGMAYDWDRTPSVLGVDVWAGEDGGFLPPDRVEQAFTRLGLDPVNAVAKEVRAADFDPAAYEFPRSNWYDGPAAGVVLRNKTGDRGVLRNPAVDRSDPDAVDAADIARQYVTAGRVESVVADLDRRDRTPDVDAVYERILERLLRAHRRRLPIEGDEAPKALRAAVVRRVRAHLEADGE